MLLVFEKQVGTYLLNTIMQCIRRTILLLVGTARQRAAIGGAIFS